MKEQKNQKQNTNKGITLIALVITIIVMLILVGVTISMAVNGGLFNYAGKAVGDTNNAMKAEEQLSNGGITIGEKYYNSVDEYLNSVGGTTGETLVSLYKAGKLNIGDYVDYKPAGAVTVNPDNPENAEGVAIGALTGYTTAAQSVAYNDVSWRVLGYDETKDELLLISAKGTESINFYGQVGYNNCVEVLQTVCSKLYSNATIGARARSITMEDIDAYLGGSAFDKKTYEGYGYRNQAVNSCFEIDAETGNITLLPNDRYTKIDVTSNAFIYTAADVVTDIVKLDLLQGNGSLSYTVASRFVDLSNTDPYWGVFGVLNGKVDGYEKVLCNAYGEQFNQSLWMRPIVSIPSSVTTNEVPIKEVTAAEVKKNISLFSGKTVNYGMTYDDKSVNKYGEGKWEILYADEKNIYLITRGHLENGALSITDKDGKEYNGSSDFAEQKELEHYPAVAQGLLKNTYDPTKTEKLSYSSDIPNMKATQYLLDNRNWSNYVNAYADWAIGGPTLELFVNCYNTLGKGSVSCKTPSGNGYKFSSYDKLFTTNSVEHGTHLNHYTSTNNSPERYWIACPLNSLSNTMAVMVGSEARVFEGSWPEKTVAFRPVVCLDSNVKLTFNGTTGEYDLSWRTVQK